jgi:hypothetical protein
VIMGCGQDPEEVFKYSCAVPCIRIVQAHQPIDCPTVEKNLNSIVKAYGESGLLTENEACQLLTEVSIYVRDAHNSWIDAYGRRIGGLYVSSSKRIELTKGMDTLAHETLHAYEDSRDINTVGEPHTGWGKNSQYQDLMREYSTRYCSLISCENVGKSYCSDSTQQAQN